MFPEFTDDGLLPPGIHPATQEEFEDRFVIFDRSDRRLRLYEKLRPLIDDARSSGIIDRFFVVGSYVTDEAEPNDFDCLMFFESAVTGKTLRPVAYNVISSTMNRRIYGGDILAVRTDTPKATELLKFFQQTREETARGIVEIML